MSLPNIANATVNALHTLARSVDQNYSYACADSRCANRGPLNEGELMVSLLHMTALALNASGLCDEGHFNEYIDYSSTHGWRTPKLTGLPANWKRLPTRRLVQYLSNNNPDVAEISEADRDDILNELDARDEYGYGHAGDVKDQLEYRHNEGIDY